MMLKMNVVTSGMPDSTCYVPKINLKGFNPAAALAIFDFLAYYATASLLPVLDPFDP
jgi:hypothetical protein